MDTATTSGFDVRCDTGEGRTIVRASGELDAHTARELLARTTEQLAGSSGGVDLDLSGVSFLDSGGLRALALLDALGGGGRGGLRLVAPSPAVCRVLALTGQTDRFTVVS